MCQMRHVLNFLDPVAVQVQNIQLLKSLQVLDSLDLVLAKHENLRQNLTPTQS